MARGTLRCTLCGINYPVHPEFQVCPIHDVETSPIKDEDPDDNWREAAQRLYLSLIEDELRPYPKVEDVPLTEENGLLWAQQSDLVNAGFRPSVLAGGRFALFELNGDVYELQGWDETRRRWWVERVGPAPEFVPPKAKKIPINEV